MIFKQLIELIRKEMLVLIRDRQTILLLFLMPVALIFFMSLALEGVWEDKLTGRKIPMVVDNQSRSPQAGLLAGKIKAHPLIVPMEKPAGADNDRLFVDGTAQAVVMIPPGFEEGDRPVEIFFDPVMDASYRIAARSLVTSIVVEVVMGVDNLEAMAAGLVVERTGPNRELPTPLQQTVPAYAIFAMFFIAVPMSVGFLREKKDGTLQRLFTYPVSANLVTLGKITPYFLINVVQFVLMMLVGVFVMSHFITPAFFAGQRPWHMLPVTLVAAAATTGFGVLVAATAKTPEQSSTLAAMVAILMGVFGGIMVPHAVMPPVMKKLAMISPMFWAHQAYLDIFLRDAAFGTIAPKLIILTLFAGICFYIAGRKVRWI
ncbi:MAG: ABC transporter permease [Smithella sp.]|nr:ABC transporter permease [Smithella sp.]